MQIPKEKWEKWERKWYTKHYTENKGLRNRGNWWWTQIVFFVVGSVAFSRTFAYIQS
jgi:uncharacterized membrane protein YhaH (DUF805 family)